MKETLKKIWKVVKWIIKVFTICRIVFGFIYHWLEAIIGCLRHVRKNKQEFNATTAWDYMNYSGETESIFTGVFRLGNEAWNEYVGYLNDRINQEED